MKVARAGPTRQASLSSRSRERPGTVDSTPHRDGRQFGHRRRTRAHDSGAAHRRSGCRRPCAPGRARSGRCDRSGGPTSRTAWRRRRRVSDNGSRHARPEEPRTARSLCRRAACRAHARSALGAGAGGEADGGGGTAPVEVPDAGPKGPSDDGGRDELVEVPGQLLGLLDRQRMQTAQQLDPGVRAQRLEEAAVHTGKINRSLARHTAIESEPAGECHPHIARPIPRAASSSQGR